MKGVDLMEETLSCLMEKQVVNLCDGKILGYVNDFKVDICQGCLTAIVIPGESGFFCLKKCTDLVIPWCKICKIGKDSIIVYIEVATEKEKQTKKTRGFFS
jgi:YlmC/YmxH family sporulation protein